MILALAWTPDGLAVATGAALRVVDPVTHATRAEAAIRAIAVGCGDALVVACADQTCRVLDPVTLAERRRFDLPSSARWWPHGMAVAPDGATVAVDDDGRIDVYAVATGERIARIAGSAYGFYACATQIRLSPTRIAFVQVANHDLHGLEDFDDTYSLHVVDLATRTEVLCRPGGAGLLGFAADGETLVELPGVTAIAFAPDGRRAVARGDEIVTT